MAKYNEGDEPLPGYRLVKFLGKGGFGEVWKATAPGGTEQALKFIDLDQKQALKEFKSLRLVKRIHHPNLTPIIAFWLKSGDGQFLNDNDIDLLGSNLVQSGALAKAAERPSAAATIDFTSRPAELIIAIGLGERSLLDRLRECQEIGLQGIPPDELLNYIEGSAKAIDFLNNPRHDLGSGPVAIQHCDIKPQNILIVGGEAQVCDFGLARALSSDMRGTSVAASLAYGSPELLWENRPTAGTDQYSLAISYYELRTGRLPFPDNAVQLEVMKAHRDGTLDFSGLNDDERAVVHRACSVDPKKRFAKCADMAKALRRAYHGASGMVSPIAATAPPSAVAGSRQPGKEIVPGYVLRERLVRGTTEVWSAAAADGSPMAILFRSLAQTGGSVNIAALQLLQENPHPHVAELVGVWLLDALDRVLPAEEVLSGECPARASSLVLAGRLAHSNLLRRLDEYRDRDGGGIPGEELLGYMRQIASAVDWMNEPRHLLGSQMVSLVHNNLRPINFLLYGDTVKIGSAGWTRVLDGDSVELPEAARHYEPPFGAPELKSGRLNRWSDQYSLAISYVQLRTGMLPVDAAASTGKLYDQQRRGLLDLRALPEAERKVIERAVATVPNQRFGSCQEMVAALEAAYRESGGAAAERAAAPARDQTGTTAPSAAAHAGTMALPLPPSAPAATVTGKVGKRTSSTVSSDTTPVAAARESTQVAPAEVEGAPVAKPAVPVRLLGGAAAVVCLCTIFAIGFFTGNQAEKQARELMRQELYQQAVDLLRHAGFWQRWRLDRDALTQEIIAAAAAAATAKAENGKFHEACQLYGDLEEFASKKDWDDLRGQIIDRAAKRIVQDLADHRYREAAAVAQELKKPFPEIARVNSLRDQILVQGSETAESAAGAGDFAAAGAVYKDLTQFAPSSEKVMQLQTRLIDLGFGQVDESLKQQDVAAAAVVCKQLVDLFPQDTGVDERRRKILKQGCELVRQKLNAGAPDAVETYHTLAELSPNDSSVVRLKSELVEGLISGAEKELDDGKWGTALASYRSLQKEFPDEPRLRPLSDTIFKVAEREGIADPETVQAIEKSLEEAFPNDPRVVRLANNVATSTSVTTSEPAMPRLDFKALEAAWQQPEAPDWEFVRDECQKLLEEGPALGPGAFPGWFPALRAEAMIGMAGTGKMSTEEWNLAGKLVAQARSAKDADQAYAHYVEALLSWRNPRSPRLADAADQMQQAWSAPSPALTVPWRQQQAAELFVDAAENLTQLIGPEGANLKGMPQGLAQTDAERVYGWLEPVAGWVHEDPRLVSGPKLFELRVNLAAAAVYRAKPDDKLAFELSAALLADAGNADSPQLLLIGAKAAAPSAPREAILRYASIVKDLIDSQGVFPVAKPVLLYTQVVEPALELDIARQTTPDATDGEIKQALARLYDAKGRLIRDDPESERLAGKTQEDSLQAKLAAFDMAARFDPAQMEYRVQRGLARLFLPSPDFEAIQRDDLAPLFDTPGREPSAGAYGLRGMFRILESRVERPVLERRDLLLKAVDDCERALAANAGGAQPANLLIAASTAHIELANYLPDDQRTAQREHLDRAVELAGRASDISPRPHPEYAYVALGNAEEDYGWLLSDNAHYCAAVEAFNQAASAEGISSARSLYHRGRCRYKLVLAGASCDNRSRTSEIDDGVVDLEAAIADEAGVARVTRADACDWLAKLHLLKTPKRDFDDAEAAEQRAMELVGDDSPRWAKYAIAWAAMARMRADESTGKQAEPYYAEAIRRGEKVLEHSLTSSEKADIADLVATTYARLKNWQAALGVFDKAGLSRKVDEVQAPEAGLLALRSRLIARYPDLWKANKALCTGGANKALEFALASGDKNTELLALVALALDGSNTFTQTRNADNAKALAERYRTLVKAEPASLANSEWRVRLAEIDYLLINRYKATDVATLTKEAKEALGTVAPWANRFPAHLKTAYDAIRGQFP